jgi:hypothetical protein
MSYEGGGIASAMYSASRIETRVSVGIVAQAATSSMTSLPCWHILNSNQTPVEAVQTSSRHG